MSPPLLVAYRPGDAIVPRAVVIQQGRAAVVLTTEQAWRVAAELRRLCAHADDAADLEPS